MKQILLFLLVFSAFGAMSQAKKDTFTVVKYYQQSEWVHVCALQYKNGMTINFYAIGQKELVKEGVKVVVPRATEGTGVKELYFIYEGRKYVLLPNPSPVK